MKKLVLILSLIFLFLSCTTIDPRYTGKKVRFEPEEKEYSDYYPSTYHTPYYYPYRPYYYSPFYWMGLYWGNPYFFWNPFFHYGFYDYYFGYYPGYYWGYPYYWSSRYGRSVITRRQLKKGIIRNISKRNTGRISRSIKITSRTGSRISRPGSSIRSRAITSRRVSSGRVKRKR